MPRAVVDPEAPLCGWCDGRGVTVRQATPGKCPWCDGTGHAMPPPEPSVPGRLRKLYEAQQ